ncbi:sugar-specific transcriptional regulator TrmB/DNA-binding CsgD family transcriptional regulator [Kribbella aluminosa]|uniref:Sugar-specific transcriptional regulator TrmB/DNA-binding CsgD family transcriptional regulator n=1 Tax=Kribbella aluminosa TaxID=416017 RepID=A0ABS4UWR2_9ACTN|nr:LuxR family transcriptional regulator [Kribbella aluminosa]MBP2356070.1 sugar-specific transcriptional regulator TrmB/DNA-binding CsgD family transcriptional regulator [Kribbella aluminosa]
MVTFTVSEALSQLGLSREAGQAYQELLSGGVSNLEELTTRTGMSADAVGLAHRDLVDAGLVNTLESPDGVIVPLPPQAIVEILGRHRAAEIDESRLAVASAFEAFRRRQMATSSDNLVEVVTGSAIGPRMRQLYTSARKQIRQLDSPPYYPHEALRDALENLARGVEQRIVYARESLTHPGKLHDDIEPSIEAGEQARVAPEIPVKLIIVDETVAMVSFSIREVDVFNTMLVVQPCGLFTALAALFEHIWRAALPFHDREVDSQRLLAQDRRLLALLAGGVSDEAIAHELGVSRRTLYRRVEILGARLGASTRFQLALLAQRRGWL